MAFGVKSAAGILQRATENKLRGLKHAVVRVNNVLVWRRDDKVLLESLWNILLFGKGMV